MTSCEQVPVAFRIIDSIEAFVACREGLRVPALSASRVVPRESPFQQLLFLYHAASRNGVNKPQVTNVPGLKVQLPFTHQFFTCVYVFSITTRWNITGSQQSRFGLISERR